MNKKDNSLEIDVSTKFTNTQNFLGLQPFNQLNSDADFESAFSDVSSLVKLIRVIQDDFDKEIHSEKSLKLCVDFDVIKSAMEWKSPNSRNSYWASMLLHLDTFSLEMLPGTLFEIRKFIEKKERKFINSYSSNLGDKLLNLLYPEEIEKKSINTSLFGNTLTNFTEKHLPFNDFYILNLIRKKVKKPKDANVENHMVDRIVDMLSTNTRISKTINNRVDAINYACCHRLNVQALETNEYYLLISDTKPLQKLDAYFLGTFESEKVNKHMDTGFVRSSMTSCIYLLVRSFCRDASEAINFCYELLRDLEDYKHGLTEYKRKRNKVTSGNYAIKQNYFFSYIKSVEKISYELERAKTNEKNYRIKVLEEEFSVLNPKAFFFIFQKEIDEFLTLCKHDFVEQKKKKVQVVDVEVETNPRRMKFLEQRLLKSEFYEVVAATRVYNDFYQLIIPQNIQLLKFLDIFNFISSNIVSSLTNSISEINPSFKNAFDSILIVDVDDNEQNICYESRTKYLLDEICEDFCVTPHDIEIFRIETPVFTLSYEDGMLVFQSSYSLDDEIELFFQKTVCEDLMIDHTDSKLKALRGFSFDGHSLVPQRQLGMDLE